MAARILEQLVGDSSSRLAHPELRDIVRYVLPPMLPDPALDLFRILCEIRMGGMHIHEANAVLGRTIADPKYRSLLVEYVRTLDRGSARFLWSVMYDDNPAEMAADLQNLRDLHSDLFGTSTYSDCDDPEEDTDYCSDYSE